MDFHCLLMCMIGQLKGSLLVLHSGGKCVAFQCWLHTAASNVAPRCYFYIDHAVSQLCFPLNTTASPEREQAAQVWGYLCVTGVKSCPPSALTRKPAFTLPGRAEKLRSNTGTYP